jgi:hypothetical protein
LLINLSLSFVALPDERIPFFLWHSPFVVGSGTTCAEHNIWKLQQIRLLGQFVAKHPPLHLGQQTVNVQLSPLGDPLRLVRVLINRIHPSLDC